MSRVFMFGFLLLVFFGVCTPTPTVAPTSNDCVDNDDGLPAAYGLNAAGCAGLSSNCDSLLCPTCPYPSYCDATCGFCNTSTSMAPSLTPALTSATPTVDTNTMRSDCTDHDENLGDVNPYAYAAGCAGSAAYCESTFCPTCAFPGYCDVTCGFCSGLTIAAGPTRSPTSRPSGAPTRSAEPTVSLMPTPDPSIQGETTTINVANFSELKNAIEGAPQCHEGRVDVRVTTLAITMGSTDAAISIPYSSCVQISQASSRRRMTASSTPTATPTSNCADDDAGLPAAYGLSSAGCAGSSAYCDSLLCPTCSYPGTCDATCGYCAEMMATPTTSPTSDCADDDVSLPAAYGLSSAGCAGSGTYCESLLCPTCSYPGTCDATCGYCAATTFMPTASRLNSDFPQLVGNGQSRFFFSDVFVRSFSLTGFLVSNARATDGSGGAIEFSAGCEELSLADCILVDNEASEDGGALHVDSGTEISSVRISRSEFISNCALKGGGAFSASGGVVVVLRNTTFARNSADVGGGLRIEHATELDAESVNFIQNDAATSGGGMACEYGNFVRLNNTMARGNVAQGDEHFDFGHFGSALHAALLFQVSQTLIREEVSQSLRITIT